MYLGDVIGRQRINLPGQVGGRCDFAGVEALSGEGLCQGRSIVGLAQDLKLQLILACFNHVPT